MIVDLRFQTQRAPHALETAGSWTPHERSAMVPSFHALLLVCQAEGLA